MRRPWLETMILNKLDEPTHQVQKEPLTEEQKMELRRKKKIMEIERRKALKAAKLRKSKKHKGNEDSESDVSKKASILSIGNLSS